MRGHRPVPSDGVFTDSNVGDGRKPASRGKDMNSTAGASPLFKARIAGLFYLLVFVTGIVSLVSVRSRGAANLVASGCYVVVTILFYQLFKPVSRGLSLLAALFSLVGCVLGALMSFHLAPAWPNSLGVFGVYCLLIGYLILKSTFLPRILGALMMFGGLGWLTFLSDRLAGSLSPFNMAPGIIGELALTLWLLVKGVNAERWYEQAAAATEGRS
jgi:Domain of unknown function (DUF4386)